MMPMLQEFDPHNPKLWYEISYAEFVDIQDEAIAKEKQDKSKTLSSFCSVVFGAKPDGDNSSGGGSGKILLPWGEAECNNYWNSKRIAYVQYTPETYKIATIMIEPIDNGMGYEGRGGDSRPNKYLSEFLDSLSKKYDTRPYFLLSGSKYSLFEGKGEFMYPLGDTSVHIYVSTKYDSIIKRFECIHDKYVDLGKIETQRLVARRKDEQFNLFSQGDCWGYILGKVYTTKTYDPFYDDGNGYIKFGLSDNSGMNMSLEGFATCISKSLAKIVVKYAHQDKKDFFFELCEMTGKKLGTKVAWEKLRNYIYTADAKKGEIDINIRYASGPVTFTIVHRGMERLAHQELRQWKRNKEEETKSKIRQEVDSL